MRVTTMLRNVEKLNGCSLCDQKRTKEKCKNLEEPKVVDVKILFVRRNILLVSNSRHPNTFFSQITLKVKTLKQI